MSQKNLISTALAMSLLLTACSDPKPDKELSFDEITPASEKYKEGDSLKPKKVLVSDYFDSLSPFSHRFIDSMGLEHKKITLLKDLIFPDRFGALRAEKWALSTATDSLVFMYWKFSDSIKTENTFFNWIDCFGPKCVSIHVGDNRAFSKRAHLFLVQGQYLFCIESGKKLDPDRILSFFDTEKWEKQRKYIAIQQAGKKTVWKKRNKEGELLDYQE